jgi:hypothetical protein
LESPSELSVFKLKNGKFERKTSGNWSHGIFGGLGLDPHNSTFSGPTLPVDSGKNAGFKTRGLIAKRSQAYFG